MRAWPLHEALIAPLLAAVLAALLPHLTARLLAVFLLRELPPSGEARARRLWPFRQAAFVVGLVQLQLVWLFAARAAGPLLGAPAWAGTSFGVGCVVLAFLSGGMARARAEGRSTGLEAARFRLSLVPYFAGPLLAAWAASLLVQRAPSWGVLAVACALCVLGVAYGGLLLSVLTGAWRPAPPAVRALAMEAAAREGTPLWFVFRVASRDVANAAAIPWARAVVVTDRIVELLPPDELRAVLAHECGHLSEPAWVVAARLGVGAWLMVAVAVGLPLAARGGDVRLLAASLALLAGLVGFVLVRRLARRMEERADAHARATSGPAALASALEAIHVDAEQPRTTGLRRVHPDLYDRIAACGVQGARPLPPPRHGRAIGALVGTALVALAATIETTTDVFPGAASATSMERATNRLRIDPSDADAVLATAWFAERDGRYERALQRAHLARALGADTVEVALFEAELHASEGDCAAARAAFDDVLRQSAARAFEAGLDTRLTLDRVPSAPPTLLRRCALGP